MPGELDAVQTLALQAVLVLTALLAASVCYTLGHRLVGLWTERRRALRRSKYQEQALLLSAGELSPVQFVRGLPRRDHLLAEDLLVEIATKFSGEVRGVLADAFVALGAVDRNRKRTGSRLWWVRADAARRLGLMGAPAVTRTLRALLKDPNAEVRIAAARAMIELGRGEWLSDLILSLDEENTFSALRLADVIMEAGPQASGALIGYLSTGRQPRRIAIAVEILGDMRAHEAEPVIQHLLVDSDSVDVRAACCRALGRFESPLALEILSRCLCDPSWVVRSQAVQALGQIGDPAAIPWVEPLLAAPEPWLVAAAAKALYRMGPLGEQALHRAPDTEGTLLGQVVQEVLQPGLQGGGARWR